MAPRASSDEEEPDVTRHTLPKDTALQEVNSTVYIFLENNELST